VQPAKLITRILQTGKTEAEIARLARTTQPTINRIRSGAIKDPRSSLTERLRRVHDACVPQRPELARGTKPRCSSSSASSR
jgi:predicted transcriptional regulator